MLARLHPAVTRPGRCLAQIEVISKGEVVTREVVQQALKHNPKFFNALYFDLIHQKKDEETILAALSAINCYLDVEIGAATLKGNMQLHNVIQQALNELENNGTYAKIIGQWGQSDLSIQK